MRTVVPFWIPASCVISLLGSLVGCNAERPGEGKPDLASLARDADSAVADGETSADSVRAPTLVGTLIPGARADGSFASGTRYLAWTFEASAGQRIQLRAHGNEAKTDPVLFLYQASRMLRPSGRALASADDSVDSLDAVIDWTSENARTYVAVVRTYRLQRSGTVTVSLALSGPADADGGASASDASLSFPLPDAGEPGADAGAPLFDAGEHSLRCTLWGIDEGPSCLARWTCNDGQFRQVRCDAETGECACEIAAARVGQWSGAAAYCSLVRTDAVAGAARCGWRLE